MITLNSLKSTLSLKAHFYILSNILSYYLLTFFGLVSLIILLQFFRISDLILVNGGDPYKIYLIIKYLLILTLPILIPTTLLISLFLSYKSLREENELIAFASVGLSDKQLLLPSFVMCALMSLFCYICSAKLAPEAHIKSSIIENQIKSNFLKTGIRPKIYYDQGNFVLYSEDKINNEFINIFIKDKKENSTTFAKKGRFVSEKDNNWFLNLELIDGKSFTKRKENLGNIVQFEEYKIPIPLNSRYNEVDLFHLNQTNKQIFQALKNNKELTQKKLNYYYIEILKRFNLSLIPLVFWIIFITFGFSIHNRTAKSSLFAIGILIGISYWITYFMFEAVAFASQNKSIILLPFVIYTSICLLILFLKNKKQILN